VAPINDLNFEPWLQPTSKFKNYVEVDTETYDFEGIVKLSGCSGSLVQFEGQADTDKALMLTNGHCLDSGFVKPGEVVVNKVVTTKFKLFKKFVDAKPELYPIQATKIIYATMTKTDVALYELSETYREIFERTKVAPLTLSKNAPATSTEIEIISGYWSRGYSCEIDGIVHELQEAGWKWKNSLRYSEVGCDTIGGTSGSPILEKGTRTVIGINNTGNEDGERCSMNNPCEVDENGQVTVTKGASYGQNTFWFYSCLDKNFKLNLELDNCQLPK
jgi:V8-like Glu-specific endopeptidase